VIVPSLKDPYCTVPLAVIFTALDRLPAFKLAVPSVKVPPCTVPLNVAPTPDEILPEAILNVPSVTVPPSTVPDAVMFPTCGLSTSPTWI